MNVWIVITGSFMTEHEKPRHKHYILITNFQMPYSAVPSFLPWDFNKLKTISRGLPKTCISVLALWGSDKLDNDIRSFQRIPGSSEPVESSFAMSRTGERELNACICWISTHFDCQHIQRRFGDNIRNRNRQWQQTTSRPRNRPSCRRNLDDLPTTWGSAKQGQKLLHNDCY